MELEDVISNIRAIPEENKERFQESVVRYFPIMTDLLERCWSKLASIKEVHISPIEREDGLGGKVPLDPELNLALLHCEQMDSLLLSMFEQLRVRKIGN